MPEISGINNIPTEIDEQRLVSRLKIREEDMEDFRDMLAETRKIARPRGMYGQANIDQRNRGQVIIEGLKFDSKVLEVNLEQAYKVFPYIVTVGTELERWSEGIEGVLEKYWADSLKEEVLRNARNYLLERLDETYNLQDTADMNPGSLKDWPIDEQRKLFKLLGDPEARIGVKLTESMLMYPTKSVSGLRFPTEVDFENCQLCPREDCPGRRAPYEPELYKKRYGKDAL